MFRARLDSDFNTLRSLHSHFIQTENHPAALLCLDPTFMSTLPQQGILTADPGPELSLHFSYFELLDRLRREGSLNPGSMRQKVFAFQSRESDRFFVPINCFLYAVFAPRQETVQEKDGCVVAHEELRRVLELEISDYIHLRAKNQHRAYRRRLATDPCLAFVARGEYSECSRRDCQFQHIRPEKMTISWFNARIRSVLMEIRILNLAGFHSKGVILCVFPLTMIAKS